MMASPNEEYVVAQRLAGEWYPVSTHPNEHEARDAAIELARWKNRGYLGYPYKVGVLCDEKIVTADAMGDFLSDCP
jgi:hypothetical protein